MEESQFGAPKGHYVVEFLGVEDQPPLEGSGYGPGLEWRFKVVEGPYKDKIISRTTALKPTLKNSCGQMLSALAGGAVDVGIETDVDAYKGRRYQVRVEANYSGNGTRVGTVMPLMDGNPAATPAATAPSANGAASAAPPPPPAPRPAGPGFDWSKKFWVVLGVGKEPTLEEAKTVQDHIATNHLNPDEFQVCVPGSTWEPAALHGFKETVPW
jgi:hypothetical protein